jgi:hypothetical protein
MRTQYFAILCFIFLLSSTSVFAGNYSWTGTSSTNWATSTNWNPNGVPTTNDTVTIITQTNQPLLAANTTVMNFTMTSGTLNCNGYTFIVSATSSFNGGTINNGTVTCSGTSTLTFAGTTFGAVVNATGNSLLLNGSRFNSTFTAVKKGTANNNGNGGNYFSGAVTITDSSSGNLVLSNTSAPDTFNSTLTLAARSTGSIYIAHQGTGNLFNGNVTFSTGNIYSNTYGTATYNGNITVNSTSSNIYFGNSTGSATLSNGKIISIGTFNAGTLTIRNLTQNDSTVSITLPLTGTATLNLGSGNTFRAKLKASSNALTMDGSRYFGVDTFVYLGGSASSTGFNYFGNSVYFKTTASSALPFKVGGGGTDTFATTATFVATSLGTMNVWRSVFMGQTYFKNETTTQTTTISTLGCIFKGNLTVESANGGIEFLKFPVAPQNNSILDSTATFTVSTGYKGLLHLKEFEQRGNNAMNLQMPQITTSNLLKIGPGATFNADFTFKGNRVFLNGGIFNGNASFTRTCPNVGDIGDGGNIFNGTTLICDSANAAATRFFKMATLNPDTYNGNVKFKQYATGSAASTMNLYPAYTKNSTFAGNITVESNNIPIEFGANGGKVIFSGSGIQTLIKIGTYSPTFKKIEVNKSSGLLDLASPITISDSLQLTKGVLTTDTLNCVTLLDNSILSGGNDSAFIHGPVKKIGNDPFTFALGDTALHSGSYHPLSITAPTNALDAFTASYYSQNSSISDSIDSIGISNCEYWNLKHDVGNSKVKIALGWNDNSCLIDDTTKMLVLGHYGSTWTNYGQSDINIIDSAKGEIISQDSANISATAKHTFVIGDYKQTCFDAYNISVSDSNGLDYSFVNGNDLWFSFVADSQNYSFDFKTNIDSVPIGIESIIFYSGNSCSNLTLIKEFNYESPDSIDILKGFTLNFHCDSINSNYFFKIIPTSIGGGISGVSNSVNSKMNYMNSSASVPCGNLCSYVGNGNFHFANCAGGQNAFDGCVNCWKWSHGSPEWYSPAQEFAILGAVYYNTPQVQDYFGEGVYEQIPVLSQSLNYLLTFRYSTLRNASGNYELRASLVNSANAFALNGGCLNNINFDCIPTPLPEQRFTFASPGAVWTKKLVCFTPNRNDYEFLWFYPYSGSINIGQWVGVDDVTIEPLDRPLTNQTINCGESATLCVPCPSVNSEVQYLWSTGETTSCITVTPIATTTYNLSVSVVSGGNTICGPFILPVTVTVNGTTGNISMISGNTNLCTHSTQTYCFSSANAAAFTYSVLPSSAASSITPNGNCVSIVWNNIPFPSGASIHVISTNGSSNLCDQTADFPVYLSCPGSPSVLTFCSRTASSVLADATLSSYVVGNTFTVPSGDWVSISGTFLIDVDFTFNNSDVRFADGAIVHVNAGKTFEVTNQSHLHSCDGVNTWGGIRVNSATAKVYIHDSPPNTNLIEEAEIALLSTNGGDFELNSTIFRNNHIGIWVSSFSSTHPGQVYGCTFEGTGLMLAPHNIGSCSGDDYPIYGIYLADINYLQIGDASQFVTYGRNVFKNLKFGISALRSSFDVYASRFQNIAPASCGNSGVGILAQGILNSPSSFRLRVGGSVSNEECYFEDCFTGIREQYNYYGNILNNHFTNCTNGVMDRLSLNLPNLIQNNIFEQVRNGIYCWQVRSNNYPALQILENLFNTSMNSYNPLTYAKHSIHVENLLSSQSGLLIEGNVVSYSRVGIFVRNVFEPCNIISNTINFQIPLSQVNLLNTQHGIQCENDGGLGVRFNHIYWLNNQRPTGYIGLTNGISINFSSTVTTSSTGDITGNVIGSTLGTSFGPGSGINISSNCSGLSLFCNYMNRCGQGITFNNATMIDQGTFSNPNWYSWGNTFNVTPFPGGAPWKVNGANISPFMYAYIPVSETPIPNGTSLMTPIQAIGHTNNFCATPSPGPLALSRNLEFNQLIDYDSSHINQNYLSYANQIQYRTKESFYSRVRMDSTYISLGDTSDSLYQIIFDSLYNSNIKDLYDAKLLADSNDFEAAVSILNSISTSNGFEYNKKSVLQIYLQTLYSDSLLDSTQTIVISEIANQHPIVGGEAVFWARAILGIDKEDSLIVCAIPDSAGSISGPTYGVCEGNSVGYSILPVLGATQYLWTVSDTNYAIVENPIMSATGVSFSDSLDSVYLYVVARNNCGYSGERRILIAGKPTSPDSIYGDHDVCAYDFKTYSISGTSGATSYNWTVPYGSTILSGQGTTSIFLYFGTVGGLISVNASNECDSSNERSINVTMNCRVNFNNNEIKNLSYFHAFPNPSSGFFTLMFICEAGNEYAINVADFTGRSLIQINKIGNEGMNTLELDLSNFSSGMYLLSFRSKNQNKIIKLLIE